ncbi:MAG: transcriptional regulator [Sulfuricurvum sp.]|nr:transcriptional regulator [Sulfuricurvum sp.]
MPAYLEQNNSKYDRLSYIYERLSRTPDGVTIKELSEEINVSTKTIQRDLHEALAGSGVYCEGRRWKINLTNAEDSLASEERIVLGVLDSLAKQAGQAFYSKAHQLLEQVSCQLEHPLFASMNTEVLSNEHLRNFSILENAIKSKLIIEANYVSVSKRKGHFKLKPLRLAFFDGFWYLLAFDVNNKDTFKKFHLKSLSTITPSDELFIYPKEIAESVEKAFSVWFSLEKSFEVRLWIDKNVAPYFERKPYKGQSIQGRDTDGSIEVVLHATHEMEILPIVQLYLPYIRILEPQWMNEILIKRIEGYSNEK